jgi:molybdopterin-guanine dinucleotide biosynthesis protein A
VVPCVDRRLQPVCARYGADALMAADSLVVAGVRALHDLFDVVDHEVVDESAWGAVASRESFLDVDTPTDAARFGVRLPGLA